MPAGCRRPPQPRRGPCARSPTATARSPSRGARSPCRRRPPGSRSSTRVTGTCSPTGPWSTTPGSACCRAWCSSGLRRDGDIEIVAHDARTGAERWRHQDSPAPSTSVPAGSWSFDTAGDVVAYPDGDTADGALRGAARSSARTCQAVRGETLVHRSRDRPAGPAVRGRRTRGPDGRRRRSSPRDADPARDRVLLGRLLHADRRRRERARPRADLARQAVRVGRGDRPAAGGTGTSRGSGSTRSWCGAGSSCAASTSVVALDGRTGDQLWEARRRPARTRVCSTDGQDLLVRLDHHRHHRAGRPDGVRLRDRRGHQTVRATRGDRRARDVPGAAPGLLADVRGGRRPAVTGRVQSRHGARWRHAGGRAARR